MGDTLIRRTARRRGLEIRRAVGEALRRLREDAGLSRAAVARAAGLHPSYLRLVEDGERSATPEVLAAIAAVLGAEVSVRVYPTTGPSLRDRSQAPMVECFLQELHARWIPNPEVVVRTPARGVIDLALGDVARRLLVASEFNSQVRRLEQQIRWHREKELSLPSSDLWAFASADGPPVTSRLLVLRSTRDLRELANAFEGTFAAAYPARTVEVLDALTGTAGWPGAGIAWMWVAGRHVRLMDGPPRGVRLGR